MSRIQVQLNPKQLHEIDSVADRLQCSRAQVIRLLVDFSAARLAVDHVPQALFAAVANDA